MHFFIIMFPSLINAMINKHTSCITVLHRWNTAARKHPVEENGPHCTRRCRVATPVATRLFSSLKHPLRLWGPPSLLFNGYRDPFLGGKAAGLRLTSRLYLHRPAHTTNYLSGPWITEHNYSTHHTSRSQIFLNSTAYNPML